MVKRTPIARKEIRCAVVRVWKGRWAAENEPGFRTDSSAPAFSHAPGGFVVTWHMGIKPAYKVEHFDTIDEIDRAYPGLSWLARSAEDPEDIVKVGI